ncbi:MAG: hypothetical protein J6U48_04490 [Alistipes sp.]|nr:hypothetical protein [Alistipes sp.]
MSFFRPHKSKPRQFNYIPRYYDPRKEERDRRRRELHGTSTSQDNEPYVPGNYIRTQREARDASRGERTGYEGLGRIAAIAIVMVLAMLLFIPRFMRFVERANEEKLMEQGGVAKSAASVDLEEEGAVSIILDERHGDIDFTEFESLTPEIINEIEEWQNSVGRITIYDDDVEIVDGKKRE